MTQSAVLAAWLSTLHSLTIEQLTRLCLDPTESLDWRLPAMTQIFQRSMDPTARAELLNALLQDPLPEIRDWALFFAGAHGNAKTIELLRNMRGREQGYVRTQEAEERLFAALVTLTGDEFVPELIARLDHVESSVRLHAVSLVWHLSRTVSVPALRHVLAKHRDMEMRYYAALYLAYLGERDGVEELRSHAEEPPPRGYAAVVALCKLGERDAISQLLRILRAERGVVARLLRLLQSRKSVEARKQANRLSLYILLRDHLGLVADDDESLVARAITWAKTRLG
jgi:hypothetical protein